MPSPKTPTQVVIISRLAALGMTHEDLADVIREETGDELWTRKRVHRMVSTPKFKIDVPLLQRLSRLLDVDYDTLIDGYSGARRVTGGDATAVSRHLGLLTDETGSDLRELAA